MSPSSNPRMADRDERSKLDTCWLVGHTRFPDVGSHAHVTALVVSLPVTWLINHIFSAALITAVFGVERIGVWRVVGLFAIVFAAKFKIKLSGNSE